MVALNQAQHGFRNWLGVVKADQAKAPLPFDQSQILQNLIVRRIDRSAAGIGMLTPTKSGIANAPLESGEQVFGRLTEFTREDRLFGLDLRGKTQKQKEGDESKKT